MKTDKLLNEIAFVLCILIASTLICFAIAGIIEGGMEVNLFIK